MNNEDLIESYFKGNIKALTPLVNNNRVLMYGYIFNKMRNKDDSNDVFQEVWIKIINNFNQKKYKNQNKFINWAMKICHNECVNFFRIRNRQKKNINNDFYENKSVIYIADTSLDPENKMIKEESILELKSAIASIPLFLGKVVDLRLKEVAFKDIAEKHNVGINTALGRMRYGIIAIKKILIK